MTGIQETRSYRHAFRAALVVNVLLLAALAIFWARFQQKKAETTPPAINGAAKSSNETTGEAAPVQGSDAAVGQEAPLAPIQLTPERMQRIGVKLGMARWKQVNDEIRVTGNVDIDERRVAYIQTRFSGWIRKVYADASYQYIHKGQPLFTIYSPDLVTTEQDYLLAKKSAESLRDSSIAGVATGAQSLLSAARERLAQWEVPDSEIERLEKYGKAIPEITFNSPASGYITERNALPNMYVQPETRLYVVADLSTVWVYAQVFQTDIGKVRLGDPATVTVDAYPGRKFEGRVELVLPQVDMTARSLRVRLAFRNPGLKLTPGMFVNVALKTSLGRQIVVPSSSIFQSGMRQLVFINRGNGQLEPREVEAGPQAGGETIILKGVKPGDSVVTSANFLIDSESQLQAAAGAFTPPPPGVGAAAAMNAPAEAQIELTTEPSPPHKGSNLFRVKLANKDGSPIGGAQVLVTFYMPAMPAMGMAAMKTTVQCSDKGGGIYEGQGEIGSGGTWQVTLVARKDGQTIAGKQFTVNATGGM